jgi:hypothetical protein
LGVHHLQVTRKRIADESTMLRLARRRVGSAAASAASRNEKDEWQSQEEDCYPLQTFTPDIMMMNCDDMLESAEL